MNGFINLNGSILDASENNLSHTNRSFRYGDGVFESMVMFNGGIRLLHLHAARLADAAITLKMKLPDALKNENILEEINKLVKKYNVRNARIRIVMFRSAGGFYTPDRHEAEFLMELVPLDHDRFILNENGLKLGVYNENQKTLQKFSHLKTCNSLLYIMAGIYKNEKGFDECIILNSNNQICEAINCNIFWVKDKTIYTPSREAGCILGVMRAWLIPKLKQAGYELKEGLYDLNEIKEAEEIFLTNAAGIQWVEKFIDASIMKTMSNEYTSRIFKLVS
jgi:branched-chain amino acid aminotransferase